MWKEDCHWRLFTDSILEEGWGSLVHDGPLSTGMDLGWFGPPRLFLLLLRPDQIRMHSLGEDTESHGSGYGLYIALLSMAKE